MIGERMEKQTIRVSVRNLVEFILRSGDIDNRVASADKDAMQLGAKIHRKIQRQMGSEYQAEVTLRKRIEFEKFDIQVEGRADGIISEEERFCIDEIKGIYRDLQSMEEPVPVHLAQAKCYAFIYAEEKEQEQIDVQMTYCNMETEEVKRFRQSFDISGLREWFHGLINEFE